MTYWKHEPLIIKGARSLLFLLYFLISLYLSHDSSPLLFWGDSRWNDALCGVDCRVVNFEEKARLKVAFTQETYTHYIYYF